MQEQLSLWGQRLSREKIPGAAPKRGQLRNLGFTHCSLCLAAVARQCRDSDLFTDLVLVCQDGRLSVHRSVL